MLAENAIDLGRNTVEIRTYRSKFYVSLKSSAVQRWAAKLHNDYYSLTTVLWKHSFAKSGDHCPPAGGATLPAMRQTYYFDSEHEASVAARDFLDRLEAKGVKP